MEKIKKKKFKDTKLGSWLKEKAPVVLNQVGDLLPDSGTLGIVKRGLDILSPEEKEQGLKEVEKVQRKLTEIDIQNANIELEKQKLQLKNLEGARGTEIERLKLKKPSALMIVLGFGLLFCYVGLLIALIFLTIPEANKDQLIHMEGIMEGGLLAMVSYYFGDSLRGENDKK